MAERARNAPHFPNIPAFAPRESSSTTAFAFHDLVQCLQAIERCARRGVRQDHVGAVNMREDITLAAEQSSAATVSGDHVPVSVAAGLPSDGEGRCTGVNEVELLLGEQRRRAPQPAKLLPHKPGVVCHARIDVAGGREQFLTVVFHGRHRPAVLIVSPWLKTVVPVGIREVEGRAERDAKFGYQLFPCFPRCALQHQRRHDVARI